jgi:hypothetical protein
MAMREAGPNHTGYVAGGGQDTDLANFVEGGLCFTAKATAALLVGDAVIVHTVDGEVTKSATTGDHVRRAGIVVGGTLTGMKALAGSSYVGQAAAGVGQQVLVCYSGIAWAIAQTTTVAIADALSLDTTTAGRVLDSAVATKNVGIALSASASAGDPVKVLVALT